LLTRQAPVWGPCTSRRLKVWTTSGLDLRDGDYERVLPADEHTRLTRIALCPLSLLQFSGAL
jgi:hypothetical protein